MKHMAKKEHMVKKGEVHYEEAGPTLLSMQPSDIEPKKPSADQARQWAVLRGHLEARVNGLRSWRSSWWTTNWADLATYIDPKRSIWLTQSAGGWPSPNNMNRGRPINQSIVDPTGQQAVRICASGIMSGLASPSRPWFKIVPSLKNLQLDSDARAYLDEVEDRMYTVMAQSNFYNSFSQECEDLVVYGTAPVIIYEDEKDLIRCYNPVVGEYYLSSGATMRIDGLFRVFVMTISQIVDFFGLENCTEDVIAAWNQKGAQLNTERLIAHAIEPNFKIADSDMSVVPGNFSWREVYWQFGQNGQKPLSIRGFVDQCFSCSRWSVQSNDAYGRSVGMDVLPDIIQLQVETMRKAEAIEKQVRPPLVADMQLKNQPSSILPGHVTYVQGLGPGTGIRPIYDVNPDIRGMMEDIAGIQQRIRAGFFNDLFLMLEQAPKSNTTAFEVAQKMQEKLGVIGPVVENVINESLKPRLRRIFGIMSRKGMLPQPPQSMQGVPLDLQFVSMLALAQKAAATGGLERIASLIGNLVPVFPEAKDNLNVDAYVREMNELLGNPQKILYGEKEVQATRQAQAKQQQQMQQMAAEQHGMNMVQGAAKAGQVLSDTEIGAGQNALSAVFGGNK